MSVLEFHSFLTKKLPVISDSARQLSYRFGISPSTVTTNLTKAGYVQTPNGWELPTVERPVTVVMTQQDVEEFLKPYFVPQSLITYTKEHRLKLLEQDKSVEDIVHLLQKQLSANPINTVKVLSLAIALHFSNPEIERY
jgi:hypothetical protein